jgi:hypothetical protein
MTLHAGTDAGSVAAFDPTALPDDYDGPAKNADPISLIERLDSEGHLHWLDPQGDGSYRLGVYSGTPLPDRLLPYIKETSSIPQFHTPSGRLYFTGIEYIFRHDDSYLRKHPHMGTSMEVPRGVHPATAYTLEYPADFDEQLAAKHLTPDQRRILHLKQRLVPLGCLATIALIVACFLLPWHTWLMIALPIWLTTAAIPAILLARSTRIQSASNAHQLITDDYPDYALVIHSAAS